MPQNANAATVAVKGSAQSPLKLDAAQSLTTGKGLLTSLNNTAGTAKLISASARRICKIIVLTPDSTASNIHDCATTGAVAASNLVYTIPQTAGVYDVDFPLTAGLVLTVGTAGVIALSYQ
jgi:hypothetical protein